ncbi:MAG: endonuclease Q family protein [Nitrospirae bacterium]|nr:endonuclease Q family protein [Nitrospirota bacterium]
MRFIADLHIHSRYSRATSKEISPETLWKWSQLKGISVIGTGDFTHPEWMKELKERLEPQGNGLFGLRRKFQPRNVPEQCRADVFFLLTAEISCIYAKNGKVRKIHSLIFAPDFDAAKKIAADLSKKGNLKSDGRPILGLDAKDLLKIVMAASPDTMLVPAHVWTPHFSVFGAASGFDTLEECFEELTPHIHAIETGLSSDPPMNWRLSRLDGLTLLSNSDAHSASKIGREANIFDTEYSYAAIMKAIGTKKGFLGTLEFFPEEGKYHYDGHRACGVSMSPEETIGHNYLCPVCGRKVTVGVMHRVEILADRKEGFSPPGMPGFRSLIPLNEIIAETMKLGVHSKAVERAYLSALDKLGNEFGILLDRTLEEIEGASSSRIAEAISRMRAGRVHREPGYDGEYGKIRVFEQVAGKEGKGQRPLF